VFDNGSFLRRRKRYKRANMPEMQFSNVFNPFAPLFIRKPVPGKQNKLLPRPELISFPLLKK
jgi:hypothetical protein